MKRYAFILSAILIALVCAVVFAPAQVEEYAGAIVQAWNYLYVKSGGEIEVETGGLLSVESGGSITVEDDANIYIGTAQESAITAESASDTVTINPLGNYARYEGIPNRIEWDWIAGSRGLPITAGLVNPATNDPDLVMQGTNAAAGDIIYASQQGGLQLQTDAADGDEIILWPYLTDGAVGSTTPVVGILANTNWQADKQLRYESLLIAQKSNIEKVIVWTGLKMSNTEVVATDTDQMYFRTEADAGGQAGSYGEWECVYSVNGTDYRYDTDVDFVKDTQYHFVIEVDSDQLPNFYINGELVASGTATANAGINLKPVVGVATDGAAADAYITIQRQKLSRGF